MNEQAIREILSRRPFQPFEIKLSSGEQLSVRHPENVLLTNSRIVIADPYLDRVAIVSLLHITNVAFPQAA